MKYDKQTLIVFCGTIKLIPRRSARIGTHAAYTHRMPCTCPADINDIRAYCCLSTTEAEFISKIYSCKNAPAAALAYIENNDTGVTYNINAATGDVGVIVGSCF